MRGNVRYDKNGGYSFSTAGYTITTGENFILFSKIYRRSMGDYILIKWDKDKLYHAAINAHPDEFNPDDPEMPLDEIEAFMLTPGYIYGAWSI